MKDVYIVDVLRTPVGKAVKGVFRNTLPDDLLAHTISAMIKRHAELDFHEVADVIIGCAMPEAEQGMNVARIASLLGGLPDTVPAMTINRFCSSGAQSIATAASLLAEFDDARFAFAGGVESMSKVPLGGNKYCMNPKIFNSNEHIAIAYGMGITAERVAERWSVTREEQDLFAYESHKKAVAAQLAGHFNAEIEPMPIVERKFSQGKLSISNSLIMQDEGPRADASLEALAALRPVFALKGSVTAGNSSQISDGAGIALLANIEAVKKYNLKPLGRLLSSAIVGVPPDVMGIGPIHAIPAALKKANLNIQDLDWIELNEAFAAQALAVIKTLDLPRDKVNPLGGAIALGHPLGATGTLRAATVLHGLKRIQGRYGLVTMCIGTGMGAAFVFEAIN
jgi:acetyl-CoA acyltransferase